MAVGLKKEDGGGLKEGGRFEKRRREI